MRLPDGRDAHPFSGTLELMRVFEELVPPRFDEAIAGATEGPSS